MSRPCGLSGGDDHASLGRNEKELTCRPDVMQLRTANRL
jgi:hypothetical protein